MYMIRIFSVLAVLLLAGCGSNPMKISEVTTIEAPTANQAQIVFMRSSFVGSAISASLYEIANGKPEFIGIIDNGTKVTYKTSPGKHTFMVVSEAADYLEANFAEGKTYYSIVTPRMGAWAARFSLWPISTKANATYKLDSNETKEWIAKTKLATLTPEAQAWFEKNKPSVTKKHDKYWPAWLEKTPEDLAQRTLLMTDAQ